MGRAMLRAAGWTALWLTAFAMALRIGLDLARLVPDAPEMAAGSAASFTKDGPAWTPWAPAVTFARWAALFAPFAASYVAIGRWSRAGQSASAASTWSVVRTRARRGKT